MYSLAGLASLVAFVGFLKIEEVIYVFMGSLSRSVMSLGCPSLTLQGGPNLDVQRYFLEDLSSMRAFRLIAFGSFPIYIAIFVPRSHGREHIPQGHCGYQATHGPVLFSVAGVIGAVVFFIGYMILLNEYPFAILKTKADVIEGPYMEYAAKYRAFVYITRGFLMFTLGCLFSTLFLGVPPIMDWDILINIAVAVLFPVLMAIFSAFTSIHYKQFYPVTATASRSGCTGLLVTFV